MLKDSAEMNAVIFSTYSLEAKSCLGLVTLDLRPDDDMAPSLQV
jgi:hypothetical protein|tara:strand:- start:986 stop:1117 length:132 start_codon:yes stop_codon:yes gene_type:complete